FWTTDDADGKDTNPNATNECAWRFPKRKLLPFVRGTEHHKYGYDKPHAISALSAKSVVNELELTRFKICYGNQDVDESLRGPGGGGDRRGRWPGLRDRTAAAGRGCDGVARRAR